MVEVTKGRTPGAGALFQLLRDGRPRTRADLAAETGQARSTIAGRIDALLASGLVTPAGEASSTGGRPPTTFAFDPAVRVVLGVDLGATHARLAVTDLASRVLATLDAPLAIADGPAAVLDWVVDAGLKLLGEAGRAHDDLVGVGVGLPGPVEHGTGHPNNPPIMPGWDDADVPGLLGARFGAPVLVDNDVNIMALGEHRAAWPEVADLLFVKVGTGIGAGIIADGLLMRGAQGAAGDLGHVALPGAEDVPCRCGNLGCLEAVASAQAVADRLRATGAATPRGADVVELVRAGDLAAAQAVRQAGRDLGAVLAACVSLLNPSTIVIGGVLAEAGEHLVAGIREVVYRRSLPLATQHLRIVTARTGADAAVLGASAMAIDHVLSPAAVEARLGA
ncbi:ROK family protein [Xylanimonas cellulosilytica DSM 15894]|uniref:ROK family protein n=1 Tax=Xylanimonas cellulosilytica (strain DSM 15894 / JCM 12276 / CECT 5975 / KCTC 9989 / LMG 20990 / NBRC 107835 / XIL07) TaxID=446471 RepID=D1BVU8_XYLCX|nr:ROK family protein [Xylanimonas cellulosilytica]ACZ31417.1 ROK family protein [Xylanimonas cellulosilytica DSM 15894]